MALPLPKPAPAKLKSRSEFSVTLKVPPSSADHWYRYEYKEAGSKWEQSPKYVDAAFSATEVVLDDLNPTCTYEVRVYQVYKAADGKDHVSAPSDVAAVDTEVPGCAPDSAQGCFCTVQ